MSSSSKNKISVAMCTYNGEKYIKEQLGSILSQTRLPDEVIICDDRSTDQTISIIQEFQKKAPFPISLIINDKQLGSTKNFEKAILKCDGDVIFLSDQDDVWMKEKIEIMEQKFLQNDNLGMVITDAEMVNDKLNHLGYSLFQSIPFTKSEQKAFREEPLDILIRKNIVTGATMAFKGGFKNILFPIDGNWVHDAWIAIILGSLKNVSVEIINQSLILYRQHSNNQLGAKKKNLLEQAADAKSLQHKEINTDFKELNEVLLENKKLMKESFVDLISNKIRHMESRKTLPNGFSRKLLIILRETLTLRYSKYSNGYKSILKDLFYR